MQPNALFKRRLYAGKKYGSFLDALPTELTLNHPLPKGITPCQVDTNETCFKEVVRVPYTHLKEVLDLEEEIKKTPLIKGEWEQDLFDTTMKIIERNWSPSKFHLVGHSTGYDSRIISAAIRKLYEKNGKEWLGQVLFVENHGEGEGFEKIMKIEGWDKSQYHVYNKGLHPSEHHGGSLRWDRYFYKFNGIGTYPVSQWYDPYVIMAEKSLIPHERDVQYFTGYGANEITEMFAKHARGISNYASWHYLLQLDIFKDYGNCVHPFWDYDWIRKVYAYEEIRKCPLRVNEQVSRTISPELNRVERLDVPQTTPMGYKHFSMNLMNEITYLYAKSWYGRQVPHRANSWLEYLDWWGHVCVASLCDYLIKQGFKLKF